jgi:hypothetical protein
MKIAAVGAPLTLTQPRARSDAAKFLRKSASNA